MDSKLKEILHDIALKNKVSDTLAKIIVETPFLFQKRVLEQGDNTENYLFYHKYLGKFVKNEKKLKKIRENEKKRKR